MDRDINYLAEVVDVMIPMLKNERIFSGTGGETTDSFGYGALSDAISCEITQERNGQFDLELRYPTNGIHFRDIALGRFIAAYTEPGGNIQHFEIVSISSSMDGMATIIANHISYWLKDIVCLPPIEADNAAEALSAVQYAMRERQDFDHPFAYFYNRWETDKTTTAHMSVKVPTPCMSLLMGQQGSILDVYGGGDYEFDNSKVKLWADRGRDTGVVIRYGDNLVGYEREDSSEGIYDCVIPYWTGKDENDQDLYVLPEDPNGTEEVVVTTDMYFPYHSSCKVLDLSTEFEEMPTMEQLKARAAQYLANNAESTKPRMSLDVDFIPLEITQEYTGREMQSLRLCDRVTVVTPEFTTTAKVVRTVFNVLEERFESIELGSTKKSLTESTSKILRPGRRI